ncbi:MAG TPA: TIGR01777 family oxidoreductase [Miltoncostaeaceae bacterium]|nr:TIGR01777 family oxidoreductase [Miltoncostaeaceae bacterium]
MTRAVAVVGASGLLGRRLVAALVARGDRVLAVSRGGRTGLVGVSEVRWDPADGGPPDEVFAGVDAVVNLAGAPIAAGRWTDARKREILSSRVQTTRMLAERIGGPGTPGVLVNASAVGYYGRVRGDLWVDEASPAGDDFLADVGRAWEQATEAAERRGARVVRLRTGLVLSPEGGILPRLVGLSRRLIGGPVGGGRQWMPWIHVDDHLAAMLRAVDDEGLEGPVNAVAPNPVRQREFMAALGRALHRPAFLPTPGAVVRLALGEMATLVLDGQRVRPAALGARGFSFVYPDLDDAVAAALVERR